MCVLDVFLAEAEELKNGGADIPSRRRKLLLTWTPRHQKTVSR